ncbi:hypothetical protein ANN_19221 [Periplaneta americana]|uniref:Uncharacterized protein n=1 Tax=Periplaneta americana TaxID=6978 RepID=A0ABQ8S991_PERAM|nr:hypothetical protein ANN_19221 [Periplaneta americana]
MVPRLDCIAKYNSNMERTDIMDQGIAQYCLSVFDPKVVLAHCHLAVRYGRNELMVSLKKIHKGTSQLDTDEKLSKCI